MKRLFWLLFLIASPGVAANTYYVRPGGTAVGCNVGVDTNAGARSTVNGPSGGIGCLASGDTLIIHGGTYPEAINTLNAPIPSGTSWATATTIKAATCAGSGCGSGFTAGYENVVMKQPSSPGNSVWIDNTTANQYQYIIFEGIDFDNTNALYATQPNSITVRIEWLGYTHPPNHIRFFHTKIHEGADCILISGPGQSNPIDPNAGHNEVIQSEVYNCGITPSINPPGGHCFYINPGFNIFDGNDIHDCPFGFAFQIYDSCAFTLVDDQNVVRNNYIHKGTATTSGGIIIAVGNDIQVYNNVLDGVGNNFAIEIKTCQGCIVANNTIINSPHPAIGSSGGAGGNVAENNIMLGNSSDSITDGMGLIPTQQNNLCSNMGNAGCQFQSTAATEFMTPGSNYHLLSGAVSRNKGLNLTGSSLLPSMPNPAVDKDNVQRPTGAPWDIGAYQFAGQPPPADTPPVEDFVCTIGNDISGLNDGMNWTGSWTIVSGSATCQTMTGSFTAGNAYRSQGGSSAAWYSRAMATIGTGTIRWQMRASVTNQPYGTVAQTDAAGKNAIQLTFAEDGHFHACRGFGPDTDLGAYAANTTYFIKAQLDAAGHASMFRIQIDNNAFSAWINFCETLTGQIDHFHNYDAAAAGSRDFFVDSIGAQATALAWTTQPPSTVNSGGTFAGTVSVVYSNGTSVVSDAVNSITLAPCATSPAVTLTAASGLTKSAVAGVASWTDLVLTQPAGAVGVTLCATATSLTTGESTVMTVNGAPPPVVAGGRARIRARSR